LKGKFMRIVTQPDDAVCDHQPPDKPQKESGRFARLAALVRESADYASQKRTARDASAAWIALLGNSRKRLRQRGREQRAQLKLYPRKP
jgi:hypothetical protein